MHLTIQKNILMKFDARLKRKHTANNTQQNGGNPNRVSKQNFLEKIEIIYKK